MKKSYYTILASVLSPNDPNCIWDCEPLQRTKSRCTPALQKAPQKALYRLAMCLEESLAPHRTFEHEKNILADISRIWMMEKIYIIAPAPRVRGLVVTNPHFYNIISYIAFCHNINLPRHWYPVYSQLSKGDVSLPNTTSMAVEKLSKSTFPTSKISYNTVKNAKGYSLCNSTFRFAIPLSNLAPGCGFKAITHSITSWLIATRTVPTLRGRVIGSSISLDQGENV